MRLPKRSPFPGALIQKHMRAEAKMSPKKLAQHESKESKSEEKIEKKLRPKAEKKEIKKKLKKY